MRQPILRLPVGVRILQQSAQLSARERRHVLDHLPSLIREPSHGALRVVPVLDEDRRARHRVSRLSRPARVRRSRARRHHRHRRHRRHRAPVVVVEGRRARRVTRARARRAPRWTARVISIHGSSSRRSQYASYPRNVVGRGAYEWIFWRAYAHVSGVSVIHTKITVYPYDGRSTRKGAQKATVRDGVASAAAADVIGAVRDAREWRTRVERRRSIATKISRVVVVVVDASHTARRRRRRRGRDRDRGPRRWGYSRRVDSPW